MEQSIDYKAKRKESYIKIGRLIIPLLITLVIMILINLTLVPIVPALSLITNPIGFIIMFFIIMNILQRFNIARVYGSDYRMGRRKARRTKRRSKRAAKKKAKRKSK